MRKTPAALALAVVILAGCRSSPSVVTPSRELTEAQTSAAVAVAETSVLAASATKDAEKLLEVARGTNDATIIYVAEKHLEETKEIAARSAAVKVVQKTEREKTADVLDMAAKAETERVKAVESASRSRAINAKLIAILAAAAIVVVAVIVLKLRKILPF